jgi:hypothetical protein
VGRTRSFPTQGMVGRHKLCDRDEDCWGRWWRQREEATLWELLPGEECSHTALRALLEFPKAAPTG